jgi:hypothetical protein
MDHIVTDLDAFADDTGFEGTFTPHDMLFQHHEDGEGTYQSYDPFDYEEVVKNVKRRPIQKDSFGSDYRWG